MQFSVPFLLGCSLGEYYEDDIMKGTRTEILIITLSAIDLSLYIGENLSDFTQRKLVLISYFDQPYLLVKIEQHKLSYNIQTFRNLW